MVGACVKKKQKQTCVCLRACGTYLICNSKPICVERSPTTMQARQNQGL